MSTTTATFTHGVTTHTTSEPRKGFFARFMEARELQGKARVRAIFERMSDAQLADIGLDAGQIRHVRANGSLPTSYWS